MYMHDVGGICNPASQSPGIARRLRFFFSSYPICINGEKKMSVRSRAGRLQSWHQKTRNSGACLLDVTPTARQAKGGKISKCWPPFPRKSHSRSEVNKQFRVSEQIAKDDG